MTGIVNLLGSYPFFGGLVTVVAGIAFVVWDYMRLERTGRWLAHVSTARWIAVTLGVLSVILMGSRFVAMVWKNHTGI
jgi:hypothetical protein